MAFNIIQLKNPVKFTSNIEIQPRDIDINGHVHHSIYLDYLLAARYDQMERCYKMSMEEFFKLGFTWIARKYEITFKNGIKLHDTALVTTWISVIGKLDVIVDFIIKSKNTKKVAAQGSARFILVDIKTRRPVKIPANIVRKYSINSDR